MESKDDRLLGILCTIIPSALCSLYCADSWERRAIWVRFFGTWYGSEAETTELVRRNIPSQCCSLQHFIRPHATDQLLSPHQKFL